MTKPAQKPLVARLMIVTPPVSDAAAFAPLLEKALASGDVAAVHLRLAPADERSHVNIIKELAPRVQARDAALVTETTPAIAIRGGADGAHIAIRQPEEVATLAECREQLKAERILGAGSLKSRHDAMDAGEAGVDYVMFGEPRADESIMALSAVIERATWWVEIFQTPCVVYAPDQDAVAQFANLGAEFIALGAWIFADGVDTSAQITKAQATIAALAKSAVAR
jgi:thiamine-phosphate pyrophosphorylase